MNTIRKKINIDSETLLIPELKDFIGKRVKLIIMEENQKNIVIKHEGKKKKMEAFFTAASKVEIDEEAVYKLREMSKL